MRSFEQYLCDQADRTDIEERERSYRRAVRRGEKNARKERRAMALSISVILATIAICFIIVASQGSAKTETNYTQKTENATQSVTEPLAATSKMIWKSNVPMDDETQLALYEACEEFNVPYEVALAVIKQETNFQNVMGDNGDSYGYMQLQPRWHQSRMERLGVTDLMDAESNFRVGCDYLAELLSKYTVEEALTAYNSGSAGSSEYATSVMGYMEEYRWNG